MLQMGSPVGLGIVAASLDVRERPLRAGKAKATILKGTEV